MKNPRPSSTARPRLLPVLTESKYLLPHSSPQTHWGGKHPGGWGPTVWGRVGCFTLPQPPQGFST